MVSFPKGIVIRFKAQGAPAFALMGFGPARGAMKET